MKYRKAILTFAIIFGILGWLGAGLFAVAGAGMYGSPFDGDAYFNATLAAVLLLGPVAILPCALWDCRKPGYGGIALCSLAVCDVVVIVLNNIRQWGFAIHDAALASLCLALPVFVCGSLLFFSGKLRIPWLTWLWRVELLVALAIAAFFTWQVGLDGVRAVLHVLRGGTL